MDDIAATIYRQGEAVTDVRGCQSDECKLEADVYLRSSDGIVYAAHSKNLELYSGGFPPSGLVAEGVEDEREVVQVTETSSVLALLLQYVHNQRQPDSSKFKFETLAGLAEAAEKYMVYSAMEVCKIRMQLSIPKYPLQVLAYATKHSYPELRDAAAPRTITASVQNVSVALQDMPQVFIAWVRYREGFIQAIPSVLRKCPPVLHRGGLETCELWSKFQLEIFEKGFDLDRIRNFETHMETELHHLKDCTHCIIRARAWGRSVTERVNAHPPFHSFL
ncbi:hypothetical protein B0H19DRAFT_134779 [Mycena capillaripes]|nr:hypothetical protein B0H19DRAFT_134779 [Mycena capillaripes]